MKKRGRKNKYYTHVKPRFNEISEWIKSGLSDKKIAEFLGINKGTFCLYKSEYTELNELCLNSLKNRWCVYQHIFPNGKTYIGITSKKPEARWLNGKGYAVGSAVRSAIDKYGWDNVEHKILENGLTEKEAKKKEIELIEKHQSYCTEKGYNMTRGGDGYNLTEEQRRQARWRRASFGTIVMAQSIDDVLDNLEKVQELSKDGASKDEIANLFGVARSTWYSWEDKEPCIRRAIESGRIEAVKKIKAALFKRATGFTYCEKTTTTDKKGNIEEKIVEKQALPDPASAMILLKHWARDEGWTNDPAQLELKKEELELKKQELEKNNW